MAVVEFEPTSQHILAGTAAVLSVTFYADGAVADPGTTTVTMTRLDGTAIATGAATGGSGAAARTYALTGAQTVDLDILSVAWESATYGTVEQTVEIVGAHLFSIRQARAFDSNAMANSATYSAADLERARERILDEFEVITGASFVPRITRRTLDGAGKDWLFLPHLRVRAIRNVETYDEDSGLWTAYSVDDLADVQIIESGRVRRMDGTSFTAGYQNVRVTYEHGWDRPPAAITQAALAVARYTLVADNVGQRTTSLTNEFGSTAFATAGRMVNPWGAYPHYGIPLVDATLARYSERVPGVA